jgi:thiaminase/transcriptional activator TenA
MGAASERFRTACDSVWRSLHEHPFIRELADGTLPPEKFRFFLEQDDFYLREYARCLAFGAGKATTERELRYFTADLNQVLDDELPSNRALLERVIELGAEDRGGSREMAPATLAYTSYMNALALRGGPLEIMACLLPCAWSYVDIATGIRSGEHRAHPVYDGWIGYFSQPSTVELVTSMREDFDRLVDEETSGPRVEELGSAFRTSARLELSFWEMAYRCEQWPDVAGSEPLA